MAGVRLDHVSKWFGKTEVIRDITLDIADGELLVFVGPSGCGKSTILRLIAGLEEVTSGAIWIGDKDVTHLPPSKRGVSMVFQSYALYPHMDAYKNIAFGLQMSGTSGETVDQRVRRVAEMLQISDLLHRKPRELSGGQRQRVALARAIVREPQVFLFDEPLSNLDAALRAQTRLEIARLHDELKTTMIYVTHDQEEAFAISDRIAVMEARVVLQVGTPQELYEHPAVDFVARFLGQLVVEGTIRTAEERTWIELGGHLVPWDGERLAAGPVRVALDIAKLRLLPPDALDEGRIRLPATLDRLTFAGRWGWRARVRLFDTVSLELYTPHAFAAADRVWVTAEPGFLKLVGRAPTEAETVRHPA